MSLVEIFQNMEREVSEKKENTNYFSLKKEFKDLEVWYIRFKTEDCERLEFSGRYNAEIIKRGKEYIIPKNDPIAKLIISSVRS